jgi:hypothetical protein
MVDEPEMLPLETVPCVRVFSFLWNAESLPSVLKAGRREADCAAQSERFWFFLS